MVTDALPNGWDRPQYALEHALDLLSSPLSEGMSRMSAVLAGLVPHLAVARLSSMCAYTPVDASGDKAIAGRLTGAELAQLSGEVPAGHPWQGEAELGGSRYPVLIVASTAKDRPDCAAPNKPNKAGTPNEAGSADGAGSADTGEADGGRAVLLVVRSSAAPVAEPVAAVVQRLWDLMTVHTRRRTAEAAPAQAATSRAAAGARARAIAELSDAHSTALFSVLGTLRAVSLDDATARRAAVDLAVAALVRLRASAELDREMSEEPADTAFGRLTGELRPLLRYSPVALDLRPPGSRRTLPADVAHTARAAVRGAVLAMLEQGGELRRLHVSWQVEEDTLRAVVRDDGPGRLAREALDAHRITDRLAALDGRLVLDPLPGWGTTVTVTLPLEPPAVAPVAADDDRLEALHPREREVLAQLALGRRNREISLALHISESTVKFHVANILAKLGAGSRGEAAALAHRAGLAPTGPAPARPVRPVRAVAD